MTYHACHREYGFLSEKMGGRRTWTKNKPDAVLYPSIVAWCRRDRKEVVR